MTVLYDRINIQAPDGTEVRVAIRGLAANRPAASTVYKGVHYFATDTLVETVCDGSAWAAPSGGGGAPALTVATVTSSTYAMDGTVQSLLIDATSGDRTITLPAPATNKGPFYLQRVDTSSHVVTITHHASEAVGTGTSILLSPIHQAVILTSDTTNWFIGADTGPQLNVVTVVAAGTYTVTSANDVVRLNASAGNITVVLPLAAAYLGRRPLILSRIDSSGNTVTVNVAGSDHINASTSITLVGAWTAVSLISNGSASWDMLPSALNITASQITSVNPSSLTGSGTVPVAGLPAFVGGGTGHAAGILPDPGGTADTTKFFRQDGTFAVPAGGGSGASFAFATKTANYTVTTSDSGIAVDASGGDVTITLPTASGSIALYPIVRVDNSVHLVSIVTTGGETINGLSTWPLVQQYQVYAMMSNNTNWLIEGGYYPSPLTTALDIPYLNPAGVLDRLTIDSSLSITAGVLSASVSALIHEPLVLSVTSGVPDFMTLLNDIVMV